MFMTNSSDIGLTCDVCGRTVQGVTFVNGMKFCAKCYQETFGEAKDYQHIYECLIDEKNKVLKENIDLRQENYLLKLFIKQKDPDLVAIRVEDKTIELPIVEPIGSGMGYTIKKQSGRSKI